MNQDLIKHLAPHGYYPSKKTLGLWFHKTRPISFTVVVDDFGMKYLSKDDINHLIDAIKEQYPIKIDWNGSKYLGIDLEWHYDTTVGPTNNGYVIASMNNYNRKALREFQHPDPKKPVYGPTRYD